MALKPFHQITGAEPTPQFVLKDHAGREYGVVEHYETDRSRPSSHMLLEFFSPDPALAKRPLIWVDLESRAVAHGHGKNLPDTDFEGGLEAYLQSLSIAEWDLRKQRARRARFDDIVRLAESGYTVAYQEVFPGELRREDFPELEIAGKAYIVDDQYGIQPGDFRNQVTLIFVEAGGKDGSNAEPAAICNWMFGAGYEIVMTSLKEAPCHEAIGILTENPELEKTYKARLVKMRREGVLLGVKPKPYAPMDSAISEEA